MAIRFNKFDEIGSSGLKTYGGQIYDSTLFKLQGPDRNNKLRAMAETDDVVSGILLTFELLGRSVDWYVEAEDKDDKKQVEEADFIWGALNDMSKSWPETLSDIYTFLSFGFAPLEIVYKLRRGPEERDGKFRSDHSDNKLGWRKFALRSQTTIDRWEFGDNGGIEGFYQMLDGDVLSKGGLAGGVTEMIPMEKMLLFRTTSRKNNPEGRAITEGAFRAWYMKHHLEDVEAVAAENNLVGIPYIQGPEDITSFNPGGDEGNQVAAALDLLSLIRHGEAEGMFIPHGWGEPKLVSSPGAATVDIDKFVQRKDSRIAISMLAGFVLTGMDKHGSFALSSNQLDMLKTAVDAFNDMIVEPINRFAIPRLYRKNGWPLGKSVKLKHGKVDFTDVKDALEVLKVYIAGGSELPLLQSVQRRVLDKAGIKLTDEEIEEAEKIEEENEAKEEEAAKTEAENAEKLAQAGGVPPPPGVVPPPPPKKGKKGQPPFPANLAPSKDDDDAKASAAKKAKDKKE